MRDSYGFVVAANFLELGSQRLETALADSQLIEGHLQLALNFVVVGLEFLGRNKKIFALKIPDKLFSLVIAPGLYLMRLNRPVIIFTGE